LRVRLRAFLLLVSPPLLLVVAAYIQRGIVGLPALPPGRVRAPTAAADPCGFPLWLRVTHYVNFLFLIMLIRSGLQILMAYPRLYWNVHCTPGTEWLRLTPVEVPKDRVWTSKDDSRHLSPWIGFAQKLKFKVKIRKAGKQEKRNSVLPAFLFSLLFLY
jgi:methionine sulfoxide reductase catalytic subunit